MDTAILLALLGHTPTSTAHHARPVRLHVSSALPLPPIALAVLQVWSYIKATAVLPVPSAPIYQTAPALPAPSPALTVQAPHSAASV